MRNISHILSKILIIFKISTKNNGHVFKRTYYQHFKYIKLKYNPVLINICDFNIF